MSSYQDSIGWQGVAKDTDLPRGSYFVHLAFEYMRDYRELGKHSGAGAAEIGVA